MLAAVVSIGAPFLALIAYFGALILLERAFVALARWWRP